MEEDTILRQIRRSVQKHATGRAILVLLIATIAISLLLNVSNVSFGVRALTAQSDGLMILDSRFSYTPDQVYALLEALGAAGRQSYLTMHLVADIIFPVVYSLLFAFTTAWLLHRLVAPDHPLQYLILLPFVAGLADLAENVSIMAIGLAYPARLDGVARFASLMTTIKYGLLPIGILVIVACSALLVWRHITI